MPFPDRLWMASRRARIWTSSRLPARWVSQGLNHFADKPAHFSVEIFPSRCKAAWLRATGASVRAPLGPRRGPPPNGFPPPLGSMASHGSGVNFRWIVQMLVRFSRWSGVHGLTRSFVRGSPGEGKRGAEDEGGEAQPGTDVGRCGKFRAASERILGMGFFMEFINLPRRSGRGIERGWGRCFVRMMSGLVHTWVCHCFRTTPASTGRQRNPPSVPSFRRFSF
jgi:hypothetical protein